MLLRNLGNGDLDNLTMTFAEKFTCRVYNVADAESCNEARATLFSRGRLPEALPPTSDALQLHIRRAHFQAMIWKQAQLTNLDIFKCALQHFVGDFARLLYCAVHNLFLI